MEDILIHFATDIISERSEYVNGCDKRFCNYAAALMFRSVLSDDTM